jgi:uncharacterized protein YkwD
LSIKQESDLNRIKQASLSFFATIVLTACGGGGGSGDGAGSAAAPNAAQASVSNLTVTPASTPTAPAAAPVALAPAAPTASSGTAAPAAVQPSSPVTAATSCGIANFQQEIMNRINAARANSRMCGDTYYSAAQQLTWNDKLFKAGVGHATDMGNKNYFSHTSQDGRTFDQRITAAGYAWDAVGENIAAGQTGLDQVMNDWLKSPGHCVNIMNDSYVEVGVTCVSNPASTYKTYWAMELGHPK